MKLKIGLAGASQLSFPGDKPALFNASVEYMQKLSAALDFELCVYRPTIVTPEDAQSARAYFEEERIDFFLLQCTTFSAGTLVPLLFKNAPYRIGIWGLKEPTREGVIMLNSFCSINMYSGIIKTYLREYGVTAKWFFGGPGDATLTRRLEVTVSALSTIKKICHARIALIGGIAPGFDDLYFDERKLEKRFPGLYLNRIHEFDEISTMADSYSEEEISKEVREITGEAHLINQKSINLMELNARFYKAYKKLIIENGYDALAISCWPKFQQQYNYSVCSVVGMLNDDMVPAACEGDVFGAVSMLILQTLAGRPTTLVDLVDIDEEDQSVQMWHCGPSAKEFARGKKYDLSVNYHGLPQTPGMDINSCGVTRDMVFAPGAVTSLRLSGEADQLFIFSGRIPEEDKPSFHGCRGWVGDIALNGEKTTLMDFINTIMVQGLSHHYTLAYGDYTDKACELSAWLGLSKIQKIPYKDYLQTPQEF